MMRTLSALGAGLLFGFGLIQSEMVNPKRVQGFLDITGQWDPTLVFVMGGALLVSSLGFKLVFSRAQPLFETTFFIPTKKMIDSRLLLGAILFGLGWGLSGLCPGPAIVGLATLNGDILVFVGAMVIGMKAFDWLDKKSEA